MFNFDLSQEIEQFLLSHSPCKEYEIIQHLQQLGRLKKDCMASDLSLFRCHFLIFNALYRLQTLTPIHGRYHLSISSLEIDIEMITQPIPLNTKQNLGKHDPLSLFYLDISNLLTTTETDIRTLLDDFWKHYFSDSQKHNALNKLGLSEPVDFKTIKQQYRRLAMQHHPDRGGNADTLIEINQAMQCLQHCYN